MANELAALSNELAGIVERAGRWVAAVHARPRFSSSGVLWRPGVIVTAEHTIRTEDDITVTLPDGTAVAATLAGSDPGTDVAVLRIDESVGEPPPVAPNPPGAGNLVVAIGRSKDSGVNATMGIVSALSGSWRTWRGGQLDHYLRLDLTLYPGSAGGAIVNFNGEVIGFGSSVLSRIAPLAVPASTVDRVVNEILTRGKVARGYLGVGLQLVELQDHQKGLIVLSVEPESPAHRSGVLIGDIIVSMDNKPVADTDDVQSALDARGVGQTVDVDLLRGGTLTRISITTAERPGRS